MLSWDDFNNEETPKAKSAPAYREPKAPARPADTEAQTAAPANNPNEKVSPQLAQARAA